MFLSLPLSAQEDLRRREKTAGHTTVGLWVPGSPFQMVSLGRWWCTGRFPGPAKPCCLFPRGWQVGGQGTLAMVIPLLYVCVCVVGASPSNYVALMITVPHDPASQWGSILIAGWLSCWSMKAPPGCVLYLSDSHLSPNHPLPTSHGNNISSGKHTYLKYCSFHHQNVNHSFAFLGRWNLWGLQLPKLCKQPLFKISLEYVLHRKKKMLCGNWALKLPWKYIYNCI